MSSLAGLGVDLERLDRHNPDYKLDVGEVLRRCFGAWRAGFAAYFVLALILQGPFVIALAVLQQPHLLDVQELTRAQLLLGVSMLSGLAGIIQFGAVTFGVFSHLRGRPAAMGVTLRTGLSRAIPAFGVGLLTGLATLIGCCALSVPGLMAMTMYYVALPAVVIEETGALATLQRSQELTKGNRWPIFGIVLITTAVSVGSAMLLGALTGSVSVLMRMPALAAAVLQSLTGLSALAVQTVASVAPAVVYHDLRVGREGADVDDLVKVFE